MLVKCICSNCAGHLAFEEENAGRNIACPHCGFQTTLLLPGTKPPDPEMESLFRRMVRQRRLKWAGAILLVLAGIGYALYRWGVPWVQDMWPVLDTTPRALAVLIAMCLGVPFLLCWLIFPVVWFLQTRKLIEAVSEISSNLPVAEAEIEEEEPEEAEAEEETAAAAVEPPNKVRS